MSKKQYPSCSGPHTGELHQYKPMGRVRNLGTLLSSQVTVGPPCTSLIYIAVFHKFTNLCYCSVYLLSAPQITLTLPIMSQAVSSKAVQTKPKLAGSIKSAEEMMLVLPLT